MSDSWYQRALDRARGGADPPPAPRPLPTSYPQQQAYPAQTPQTRYVTPVSPTQPQAARLDQKLEQADLSTLLKIQEEGHGTQGIGARMNPDPCPNCGKALYFDNLSKGKRRGPEPAPHCFECGYNGLFEQGLAGNWGV